MQQRKRGDGRAWSSFPGALDSYVRYRQNHRRAALLVAVMLYGIALFTKETAIVVWPMIVACDWWLERDGRARVRTAGLLATAKMQVPFAVVTAVYIGLRLHALRGLTGGQATFTPRRGGCGVELKYASIAKGACAGRTPRCSRAVRQHTLWTCAASRFRSPYYY